MRLTELGYEIGLVKEDRYRRLLQKRAYIKSIVDKATKAVDRERAVIIFEKIGEPTPIKTPTLGELCRRPAVTAEDIAPLIDSDCDEEALRAAVVEMKYEGYLKKEYAAIAEQKRLENRVIPDGFDYESVKALRIEARQKLAEVRPLNLGQASRVSGVSPADIAVLIVALRQTK